MKIRGYATPHVGQMHFHELFNSHHQCSECRSLLLLPSGEELLYFGYSYFFLLESQTLKIWVSAFQRGAQECSHDEFMPFATEHQRSELIYWEQRGVLNSNELRLVLRL